MRRSLLVPLAASCILAACGGGGAKRHAAPATTTTTAPPTTTSTTVSSGPVPGTAPLTGVAGDPGTAGRPALVVKVDNAPKARPQTGLNQADLVVEEKVEDGVTRFFSVFQSHDSDTIGPVRSARTTDIALVTPLHRPLFAYAGTNATFQKLVTAAPLVDVGIDAAPGEYRRHADRPAPYNLFSSTAGLFAHAPAGAMPPPPLFAYRPAGQALAVPGATPATRVHIEFHGAHVTTVVDYAFDATTGTWRRNEDGTPHTDSAGQQVAPRNVVIQFVEYRDTGQRDQSGTAVPEAGLVGEGEAWVLSDGKLVKGRWAKPAAETVTAYRDGTGADVALTPGQTWIELPPPGAASTS